MVAVFDLWHLKGVSYEKVAFLTPPPNNIPGAELCFTEGNKLRSLILQ